MHVIAEMYRRRARTIARDQHDAPTGGFAGAPPVRTVNCAPGTPGWDEEGTMRPHRLTTLVCAAGIAVSALAACSDDNDGASDAFCNRAQTLASQLDRLQQQSVEGGDKSKAALDKMVELAAAMRDAAPDAQQDTFSTITAGYETLRADMKKVDFDAEALGQPAIFSDKKFNQALEDANAFTKKECDVDFNE
jgi:hypothetical protein